MFGTLDNTQMDQLLQKQIIGRLGCHADGLTYVLPISYAYQDGYIYAYTLEGKKLSILRKNGKVCFQVDNSKDLSNWQSVICWGEFEELITPQTRAEALKLLNTRNFPVVITQKMHINNEWPFDESKIDDLKGVFFRIRVDDKTGRYERADQAGHYAS